MRPASSSRTPRVAGPPGTGCSSSPTRAPRTSPSEWAGSVDKSRMRRAGAPSPSVSAAAAAHVVLPTPPLPANRSKRVPAGATSGTHTAADSRPRAVEERRGEDAAGAGARRTLAGLRWLRARTSGRRPASPRGSAASSGRSRMGRPPKAFRTAATARCSAATRRRSTVLPVLPIPATRFTRISSTARPPPSRAWTASWASSTASISGRTIQRKRLRQGSRRRAASRRASASISATRWSAASRRSAPPSRVRRKWCLASIPSRTVAIRPSVSGTARSRSVCPVGAVSTTTVS